METSVDLTHEKCRERVCLVCYRKSAKGISKAEEKTISDLFIDGYSRDNQNFPSGLCGGCHLSKRMSDDKIKLPWTDDHDPNRPTNLRSVSEYTCRICKIAKCKNKAAAKLKAKRGRPRLSEEASAEKKSFKICATCFAKIYSGCNHSCAQSRASLVKNIEKLSISPGTSEALASQVIDKTKDKKLTTLGPRKNHCHNPLRQRKLYFPLRT